MAQRTGQPRDNRGTTEGQPWDINKNDKNVKNEKNKKKVFVKPTLEELIAYISENNLDVDAQHFLDYYESNGWMVGKNHMKDWKATLRRWHRSNDGKKKYTSLMSQDNTRDLNQLKTIEEMYLKGDVR